MRIRRRRSKKKQKEKRVTKVTKETQVYINKITKMWGKKRRSKLSCFYLFLFWKLCRKKLSIKLTFSEEEGEKSYNSVMTWEYCGNPSWWWWDLKKKKNPFSQFHFPQYHSHHDNQKTLLFVLLFVCCFERHDLKFIW